jgi:glycosyltransferase involved in cell wall biosynthesis
MISVVIPSRNEPYLQKTIRDLLANAKGQIEIIAILEGYWLPIGEYVNDPRVRYIHFSRAKGMRNAINSGVSIAKGEYILKCDAHCMFKEGFDVDLTKSCASNWVVVPRRYALEPSTWSLIANPKYPVDYMYLSNELHGVVWDEKNKNEDLKYRVIDDLMSSQGSCWFMRKDYYHELELMEEEKFGTFASEFQEIGLKCWLTGGRVIVNKNTWYAHWHKTESRGYSLDKEDGQKAVQYVRDWMDGKYSCKGQIYDLKWLLDMFKPVPTWT